MRLPYNGDTSVHPSPTQQAIIDEGAWQRDRDETPRVHVGVTRGQAHRWYIEGSPCDVIVGAGEYEVQTGQVLDIVVESLGSLFVRGGAVLVNGYLAGRPANY